MPLPTRRTSHAAAGALLALVASGAASLAVLPSPAVAAVAGVSIDPMSDGWRYVADPGIDNDVVITADADSVDLHDTAADSLGTLPDGCEPVTVDEGVAAICARDGATVLRVRLDDGSDTLDASALPRSVSLVFFGGPGDNLVLSGAGDDVLWGGDDPDARDTMYGWLGDDEIHGRSGSSYLRGHAGDDLVVAGDGVVNLLIGDNGDDTIRGGDGMDLVTGGRGEDRIDTGDGSWDDLRGGPGADRLYGQRGYDNMYGGPGRDRMYGGPGGDEIDARGDHQRDLTQCGKGNDTAYVDDGDKDTTVACETETLAHPRRHARAASVPGARGAGVYLR